LALVHTICLERSAGKNSRRSGYGWVPPTYDAFIAGPGTEVTPPIRTRRVGNGIFRSIADREAAGHEEVVIAVYLRQINTRRQAILGGDNRNGGAPWGKDDAVERSVARVDLRIVGPGVGVGKYLVHPIFARALGIGVSGEDV